MPKYVFDTNIFIALQRRQPIDIYPSLWAKISDLMSSGTVISSREVYDEISIGSDELKKWANTHREYFLPSVESVQIGVREILKKHRGLIEGEKRKTLQTRLLLNWPKKTNARLLQKKHGHEIQKRLKYRMFAKIIKFRVLISWTLLVKKNSIFNQVL